MLHLNVNYTLLILLLTLCLAGPGRSQDQPESPLAQSFDRHMEMKTESEYRLKWTELGPVMNSARVEAVQADPTRPGTIYAAFGSGGLWKTTNEGVSWDPIFENKQVQGIGDIALAPSDTDIIYLGSGESLKKARNFTMPGNGVYRSDDGGETWRHLGLNDSWHIGEIAVHPRDPDIVYVAVLGHFWSTNPNRGVYRSMNGGETWEHVLYLDEKTGANDIVISHSNPEVLYASLWENYPDISGKQSGIYRSRDGGETWEKADNGLPDDENEGRIGVAVSYSNPDKAYALLDHRNQGEGQGAAEVYKTTDGGENWEITHDSELHFFTFIGWYFADIYLNPQDDEEVYALGIRLAHSTDGGKTFNYISGEVSHHFPNPAQQLHHDHCELWINPTNPNHLISGNDGGLYVTYDRGKNWRHFNNIPTVEFYDITLEEGDPYRIYGGSQDNSTVYGPPRGPQDNTTVYGPPQYWDPSYAAEWSYLWGFGGGDGTITLIDTVDTDITYFCCGLRRLNEKTNTVIDIRPDPYNFDLDTNIQYAYEEPFFLSPHDHATIYLGGNYILKSTDQGDSWEVISPNLTKGRISDRDMREAVGALAESRLEEGLLYAGTDRGEFWVKHSGETAWVERSEGLPDNYIRRIVPSQYKKSRVYLAISGMNYDDFGTYLYQSEDYGKTWQPMKGNLPEQPAYEIEEDPFHEDILYAGMYRGVYISTDRGETWSLLGEEMPVAAVSDIEIEKNSQELVAATHGRGIYKIGLSPVYDIYEEDNGRARIFDLPDAILPQYGTTYVEAIYRTATKLPVRFWNPQSEQVTLLVQNEEGETMWESAYQAEKGFNEYQWDLVIETQHESDNPYFSQHNKFLNEGNYQMVISTRSDTLRKEFTARKRE